MSSKQDVLYGGFDVSDPEYGAITLIGKQEEVIRVWAQAHGMPTLRGFHNFLRSEDWSYYDILKEAYK